MTKTTPHLLEKRQKGKYLGRGLKIYWYCPNCKMGGELESFHLNKCVPLCVSS